MFSIHDYCSSKDYNGGRIGEKVIKEVINERSTRIGGGITCDCL